MTFREQIKTLITFNRLLETELRKLRKNLVCKKNIMEKVMEK